MLKVYVESAAFNSIFANMSDPLTPVLPAADARRKLKSQKRSAKTLLAYSGFNVVQKPSSQVCSTALLQSNSAKTLTAQRSKYKECPSF